MVAPRHVRDPGIVELTTEIGIEEIGAFHLVALDQSQHLAVQSRETAVRHVQVVDQLTDDILAGQRIDDEAAIELMSSADIIVAHNAAFDRPFIDRRLPAIAGRPWACSMAEIDWLELGFDGRALGYLVAQRGWFFEGHRAQNDILALIYLLGHVAAGGKTILARLIAASESASYKVNAVDAPYDGKDALKARGYRWDAAMRYWSRTIGAEEMGSERTWLLQEIYAGHAEPAFHLQTACERYGR